MKPINVAVIGLGAIGRLLMAHVTRSDQITITQVIDHDPELVGKRLSDIIDGASQDIVIAAELDSDSTVDVAIVTTSSRIEQILPTIEVCIRNGSHVVTAAEELSYPWHLNRKASEQLDALAKEQNCTVMSAGVNPGLLMDALPSWLIGWTIDVQSVRIYRSADLKERREKLQTKVGCGLTREEFQERVDAGGFGHVGLPESLTWIADRLEWKIIEKSEEIRPILEANKVIGMVHTLSGQTEAGKRIELELTFSKAASNLDRIDIEGTPPIRLEFPQGLQGDLATIASLIRGAELAPTARKGLTTLAQESFPRH